MEILWESADKEVSVRDVTDILPDHAQTTVAPIPDRLVRTPAAELAVLEHRGSHSDIDITYGELGAYATTHEISIEGPLREYYLVDAIETPEPEEWITEIGWPIFRSDRSLLNEP